MLRLIYFLLIICYSINGQSQSGHLIKTPYNFSVTIPENWKLLSKAEIEKQKEQSDNQNLIMPAMAYLGDKKDMDNAPHIYVIFYSQPKVAEKGFSKASKIVLSDKVRGYITKELNKKYPQWSFSSNKDEYFLDADRRLVMFTTNTKYNDGTSTVMLYCYFFMETGAAQINFSFDTKIINDYTSVINDVLDTVEIDLAYRLKKD